MENLEKLRTNEVLQPSLGLDITDSLLRNLIDTKERIEEQKEEGYVVVLVHLSGDLCHSSHVQYINTIRAKARKEIGKPFKLVVGVEADSRTFERKGKQNIQTQDERAYMFANLKGVDHVYIEFEGIDEQTNDKRPAGIVKYLKPDVMASHQEHISIDDIPLVSENVENTIGGKLLVVEYGDEQKYLGEESMREKYNRSTTNTIIQVFNMYRGNPKYDKPL